MRLQPKRAHLAILGSAVEALDSKSSRFFLLQQILRSKGQKIDLGNPGENFPTNPMILLFLVLLALAVVVIAGGLVLIGDMFVRFLSLRAHMSTLPILRQDRHVSNHFSPLMKLGQRCQLAVGDSQMSVPPAVAAPKASSNQLQTLHQQAA